MQLQKRLEQLRVNLFEPINIMPLVIFRVLFGGIMLWEVFRFFSHGWIRGHYMDPSFLFTYYGFGWVQPLPGDGMIWLFYALGVICFLIIIGLMYRVSMFAFFIVFTYIFLLDQSRYLNHFYLISLLGFILMFMPLHRAYSLDALLDPKLRATTAPRWALYWLRIQIGIPYVYGAFAKMNTDWLLGEPMREWLSARTDFPLVGQYYTTWWAPYFFSYGGLLLDLLAVPLLLWRRTRWVALIGVSFFHVMNANLFPIGIFPWMMLGASLIFFPPEWFNIFTKPLERSSDETHHNKSRPLPLNWQYTILGLIGIYVVWQLLFPFRHFLYPGEVSWTEEGHRFAWHMRLRDKDAIIRVFVEDEQGNQQEINVLDYVNPRQRNKMAARPDMILQFAHHIEATMQQQGYGNVAVRAWVMASLNSRPPQLLVDPTVDLTQYRHGMYANAFVLPLKQPHSGLPNTVMGIGYDGERLVFVNTGYAPVPLHDVSLLIDDGSRADAQLFQDTLIGGRCMIVDTIQQVANESFLCEPTHIPLMDGVAESVTVFVGAQQIGRCRPDAGMCLVSVP
ncbi:MAG: HTTM domain-containing protein [Chloroflexota bacterium]